MAFPTTGILDNFNRANAGPPPSASWTQLGGTDASGIRVVSNQASTDATTSAGEIGAYWNVATFGPDCEAYMTVQSIQASTSGSNGLEARLTTPGGSRSGYHLDWGEDGTLQLYKITAGTYATIGASVAVTMAVGYKLGLEIIGTTIKGYVDSGSGWVLKLTQTDSTFTGAGNIGMHCYKQTSAAIAVDDFGGGTVVAGTAAGLVVARRTWRGSR